MSEQQPFNFERAEYAAPPERVCANCGRTLEREYYEVGGNMVCGACASGISATLQAQGPGMMRAVGAGVGAAVAGSAIYGAVRHTGFEFSLIAILVGYLVGRAVRWGSGGRGGPRFQALAMVLTYIAITSSALPLLWQAVAKQGASLTPGIGAFLFGVSLWLPFAEGWRNILGIVILAIGVWEAWRLNKGMKVKVTGPYSLKPEAAATDG